MKEKKLLAISLVTLSLVFATVVVSNGTKNPITSSTADVNPHSLTANSAVFGASELTTSYQQVVTQDFENNRGTFKYFLAKKDASNNLVLAPSGKLYNHHAFLPYRGRITNISSITVTYSGGSLFVQSGIGGDYTVYGEKHTLTSGTAFNFDDEPNFFMITNAHAETTITNVHITYSCSEGGYSVNRLGTKYTCVGSDNNQYVLTRNGSNVSIFGQNGTIGVTSAGKFTISLASNTIIFSGSVSSDYKTLSVESIAGSNASSAKGISAFYRVYVVDDFEDYLYTGTTYTSSQTSAFTATDLRAAYYSDYAGGSGTWVTDSSFQIPTSSDFLLLNKTVAHGGSQSMTLKASTGGWMRHWSREAFDQSQHYNFGSGNKLSFWTHGAYSNSNTTTSSSNQVHIRVQVYYENFVLTDSNRNSKDYGTGPQDIYIAANSGWVERTININPDKKVYAVNFMLDNSGLSAAAYVPIDDICVCTYPVYEPPKTYQETSTRITKTYNGSVKLSKGIVSMTFSVKVGLGANGYVYAYAGENMQPTGYTITGNTIFIETIGSYKNDDYGIDATYGNWTGTLSNNNSTITINKANITGTITEYISSSQIVLNEDTVLADGSQTTGTLQSRFSRQYKYGDGSWTNDSSNADRIVQVSDHYIQGSNAIAIRPYTDSNAKVRIIVNPSNAQSQSLALTSVSFWYYVPAGYNFTIRIFTYNNYNPTASGASYDNPYAPDTYTADGAGAGWHYVNCGLNKNYNKNFAIYIETTAPNPYVVDYITYF